MGFKGKKGEMKVIEEDGRVQDAGKGCLLEVESVGNSSSLVQVQSPLAKRTRNSLNIDLVWMKFQR